MTAERVKELYAGQPVYTPEEQHAFLHPDHSYPLETCQHPGCVLTRQINEAVAAGMWERVRELVMNLEKLNEEVTNG